MTSNDPNIRASFQAIDSPVAVDPDFAERVRAAVANLHAEPEHPAGEPIRINTQNPIPNTRSAPRLRWQDLAAVLVLALAGLITGAIRLMREDEPGPTILVADLTADPMPSPGAQTDGCFEPGDVVWTNESFGVRFRETPDLDGAVQQVFAIGTNLEVVGENAEVDADGNSWCFVRDPETVLVGYVMEIYLDGEEPTETAPELADVPVINLFGSAANDGNAPGIMPPLGTTYDLLWEAAAPEDVSISPYIAGNLVVSLVVSTVPMTETEPYLVVQDLESGEELWRTPITNLPSGAITPRGIVLPVATSSSGLGVVLLDLQTGQEIWSTGERFTAPDQVYGLVTVDADTIYVKDGETGLVALDLATGEERWTFDAAKGRTREEMLGECTPTNAECGQRAYLSDALAIVGDVAYRYVPLSGELVAINTADGSLRWAQSLTERSGIPAPTVHLIGTEWGVLPVVAGSATSTQYLGFWQASDGAEIWTRATQVTDAYVNGEAIVISRQDPENPSECCLLSTLDIQTGEALLADVTVPSGWIGFYPADGTLVMGNLSAVNQQNPVIPSTFVFPPTGFADPVPADEIIPGCRSIKPGMDGEHIVCQRPTGQVVIYRVSGFAGNVDEGLATPTEP